MNKRLIALFTGLSLSALAVGVVSIAKQNTKNYVKTGADPKTVVLTSIEDLYVMADETMFMAEGDISTGPETYVHVDITGENCHYNEDNSKFLSVSNGDWLSSITIKFDVRGLTSFEIRGLATSPDGHDNYSITYISYPDYDFNKPDDENEYGVIHDVNLNKETTDNVSIMHTERICFEIKPIGSLSITSIILKMTCATN